MTKQTGEARPQNRRKLPPVETRFKKGQSGNPAGRPKKERAVTNVAEENAEKAMQKLVTLLNNKDGKVALAAAQTILDRAFGKPKQTSENVNLNVNTDASEPVSDTARFLSEIAERAGSDSEDQEPVH